MMYLRGYAVLKEWPEQSETPHCIVRIQIDAEQEQSLEVIAAHSSRNMALYYATMLNEDKETEESVRRKIAEAVK